MATVVRFIRRWKWTFTVCGLILLLALWVLLAFGLHDWKRVAFSAGVAVGAAIQQAARDPRRGIRR